MQVGRIVGQRHGHVFQMKMQFQVKITQRCNGGWYLCMHLHCLFSPVCACCVKLIGITFINEGVQESNLAGCRPPASPLSPEGLACRAQPTAALRVKWLWWSSVAAVVRRFLCSGWHITAATDGHQSHFDSVGSGPGNELQPLLAAATASHTRRARTTR